MLKAGKEAKQVVRTAGAVHDCWPYCTSKPRNTVLFQVKQPIVGSAVKPYGLFTIHKQNDGPRRVLIC